ncbi:MAG: DUF3109 family protein [Bacteroidetes bacterium]|jgi:hypothetical protein|nr:DUF3109 family protein [Bacteroidota bacterium]
MFRVGDVILSEDIATAHFSCDISRCKGACCVIGDAGAPVSREEIPVLRKAYRVLKDDLSQNARNAVKDHGVIQGNSEEGFELTCVESGECIFVEKDEQGVVTCAIQRAYYEGRFDWEKPISCHLYPVRLKRIAGVDYANFEYIPRLCSAGCERGKSEGTYLADFLKTALIRRYGEDWYKQFLKTCEEVRPEKASC